MSESKASGLHIVYLSVGSNMPDGMNRVEESITWLRKEFIMTGESAIYITQSVSGEDVMYHNAVVRIETDKNLDSLNKELKDYEVLCGRVRTDGCREVAIDLDIVIFDSKIVRERDFVQSFFSIGYRQIGEV